MVLQKSCFLRENTFFLARLMERDHTKRGYSCRVSYPRVLCSQSFKVIKSMVLL